MFSCISFSFLSLLFSAYRNVVFAPAKHNSYAGSTFPGLTDSLYELDRAKTQEEESDKVEVVKKQLAILTYFIEAAATSIINVLV